MITPQDRVLRFDADFWPVPHGSSEFPELEFVQTRIRQSLMTHAILHDMAGRLVDSVMPIGDVKLTNAAFRQIRAMWWAARDRSAYNSPPRIPLKCFVYGYRSGEGQETLHVEILPGLDEWDPDSVAPV
jgi:hypothetical protein